MGKKYKSYDHNPGIAYGTSGLSQGWEECHIGPVDVMDIGGSVIWAGGWAEMDGDLTWALRLRLAIRAFSSYSLVSADAKAKALLPDHPELFAISYPPTITLDWPDFGTPALGREWWTGLVQAFHDLPPESNIAVYCEGGHGRTGTALAILASLSGQVPDTMDSVGWVRRNYCKEAVESIAQVRYIEEITGETVRSQPTSYLKPIGGKPLTVAGWYKDATGTWVHGTPPGSVTPITNANIVKNLAKGKV